MTTPQAEFSARAQLISKIGRVDDQVCAVLGTLVDALGASVEEQVYPESDLVVPAFASNFRTRLQLHHATAEEVFNKKPFEFALKAASNAAGRLAEIVRSDTNPGHDLTIDGVRYSLKTEAARGIRVDAITISKFSEARFIRECVTKELIHQQGVSRILQHLSHYDRILTLRAFMVEKTAVKYDLIEIPKDVLAAVKDTKPTDFSARTTNGGYSVVVNYNGCRAYRLVFDGSVEKITISDLSTALCKPHASWKIALLAANGSGKE